MKVNNSYYLLIKIKSTIFTSNIKVNQRAGNENGIFQKQNIRNMGFKYVDNQRYSYKY